MLNKVLSILIFSAIALGFVSVAAAQDKATEIRQVLEERDREIKQVLGDKKTLTAPERERLKNVINDGIDFEAMGRSALGDYWAKITAAQRKEFVGVFGDIVRTQSLSNLDVYRSRVTYKNISVKGDSAFVTTTTVYKDIPTQVNYVLGFNAGKWRVEDIILDDVSTADGYARSFQTVIRKKGFSSLMASLHKKLESTSS